MSLKSFFPNQTELKEAFDYCSLNDSDQIGLYETSEALKRLNVNVTELELNNIFWEIIKSSNKNKRREIDFSEFLKIFDYLTRNNKQIAREELPYNVMAFRGNKRFVMMQNKDLKFILNEMDDEDLLDQFTKRLNKGYGLDAELNAKIILEEINTKNQNTNFKLSQLDFWEYISKCLNYREKEAIKGKTFPKDPSLGITQIINLVQEERRSNCLRIFDHFVQINDERNMALQICGWTELQVFYEKNEALNLICSKLEESGQFFRAIAIAIFHFDFERAYISVLLFKKKAGVEKYYNEITFLHGILIGLRNIYILIKHDDVLQKQFRKPVDKDNNEIFDTEINDQNEILGKYNLLEINDKSLEELILSKNKPLKYCLIQHTFTFIQNICNKADFKDSYLASICKFIAFEKFAESNYILNDISISFFDRLAFALRFLQNKTLNTLIENYQTHTDLQHRLELIILYGRHEKSNALLRYYLDKTSDIQTVGLASLIFKLLRFQEDIRLQTWSKIYKEVLNRLQLWENRIMLDRKFQEMENLSAEKLKTIGGKLSNQDETLPINTTTDKLFFCACSLGPETANNFVFSTRKESQNDKSRIFDCYKCLKPTINCAICLLPVTVPNSYLDQEKQKKTIEKKLEILSEQFHFDEGIIWCQNCKHGGHYYHIMEWFAEYNTCAVTDCPCECSLL